MDNVVMGHLCQDPTLVQTRWNGRPVARLRVAVNVWRRVGEELVERPPLFHRVVCFGPQAENVCNSLRKGMEVLAVGEWVADKYTDHEGQPRVSHTLEAKVVGPTLRRAVATVTRAPASAAPGGPNEVTADPPDPAEPTAATEAATDTPADPATEPVGHHRAQEPADPSAWARAG